MRSFLWVMSLLPLAGAVIMVVAWIRVGLREPELRRTGREAVATVVGSKATTNAQGEAGFLPVVKFLTERGRSVRATGENFSHREFPEGSVLSVVYDPRRPQRVLVGPSRGQTYLVGAGVFAVIAVVLIVASFVLV